MPPRLIRKLCESLVRDPANGTRDVRGAFADRHCIWVVLLMQTYSQVPITRQHPSVEVSPTKKRRKEGKIARNRERTLFHQHLRQQHTVQIKRVELREEVRRDLCV